MVLTEGQKQAIEKLDAEMEAAKDPCSKYIAEQLLQLATSCPEVAEKILEEKKTLAGVLDAIKAEAKKHAVGGCGCVDEAQAVEIACKYYNIKATEPAIRPTPTPKTRLSASAACFIGMRRLSFKLIGQR